MTLTKLVFVTVIAVLAMVLYNIPAHAKDNGQGGTPSHGANATPQGTPSPSAKAMENSNGQWQSERKFGQERAAERRERSKAHVPPSDEPKKLPR